MTVCDRITDFEGDIGHVGDEHEFLAPGFAEVDGRREASSPKLSKGIDEELGDRRRSTAV